MPGRKQYVNYANQDSNTLPITCGVPEGSILGPLLFLIYINDLGLVSQDVFCMLFADDTSLLFTEKNIDTLKLKVKNVLNEVIKWFHTNKLSVNIDKTNYMVFRSRNNRNCFNFTVDIDGKELQKIDAVKFLGVWFDKDLNWKQHILYISKKLSKILGIFKKVKQKFGTNVLIQLYYALVYPYFLYCYTTWAITYSTALDKIVKLQKKILRVITFSSYNAHTYALFYKFNILKFSMLDMYLTGLLMFKVKAYLVPPIIRNLFTEVSYIDDHNTRQSQDFYTHKFRTNLGKFSIISHGPTIWNSLPTYIQKATTIHMFKKRLKLHILDDQ